MCIVTNQPGVIGGGVSISSYGGRAFVVTRDALGNHCHNPFSNISDSCLNMTEYNEDDDDENEDEDEDEDDDENENENENDDEDSKYDDPKQPKDEEPKDEEPKDADN